jgi:hypothetical protein
MIGNRSDRSAKDQGSDHIPERIESVTVAGARGALWDWE